MDTAQFAMRRQTDHNTTPSKDSLLSLRGVLKDYLGVRGEAKSNQDGDAAQVEANRRPVLHLRVDDNLDVKKDA